MDASVLTSGAIQSCISGNGPPKPYLQVLGIKKIQSEKSSGDRYRLQLSDGIHYQPAMMATQMNEKVLCGELSKYCVIQVDKLMINTVQNRKIMILINLNVVHSGSKVGTVLGSPQNLEIAVCENSSTLPSHSKSYPQPTPPVPRPPLNPTFGSTSSNRPFVKQEQLTTPPRSFYGGRGSGNIYGTSPAGGAMSGMGVSGSPIARRTIFPIQTLNPYQTKWTIRARVTNKPSIRTYSNSRGEGRVMSVEFVDTSGEIRGTAFNEDVDRLFSGLQTNKVYYVSRGRIKPANKQYNPCGGDYEITFTNETEIEECFDGGQDDIPRMMYNFKPISSLEEIPKDSIVDVLGVCVSCQEIQTIVTRATNKQVNKREITLVDSSGRSVICTLWGEEAQQFSADNEPVIALKGARTSEYNGVTLSCLQSTTITINPDIPEAHKLSGWYETVGKNQQTSGLSAPGGSGTLQTPYLNFKQVHENSLGKRERADYFSAKGMIIYFRRENLLYKACPKSDCNKKVIDEGTGSYMCEKCGYRGNEFKYRMIAKLNLADAFDNLWVDCFNEGVETILGMSAQDLGNLRDTNPDAFDDLLEDVNFKTFNCKIRAKMDVYNEEQRLRCAVNNISPTNYSQEITRRLSEVKELLKK